MSVYKCPICNGTGLVNGNFYGVTMSWADAMKPERNVPCRACYGRGVIVDNEPTPVGYYGCGSIWPDYKPEETNNE